MAQESKKIFDVSFAGSTIIIDGATIKDFVDDANPIDIQDMDSCNVEWSCNGSMVRTLKPSSVIMSITVIPNSPSDNALRKLWKKTVVNEGVLDLDEANKVLNCSIICGNPDGGTFEFSKGTFLSGAPAITSNGQGKMGGNTYTLAFAHV